MSGEAKIRIVDLKIGYKESMFAYPSINICVSDGELVGIIGRNGVGKSTLLRTLANLQPKISGDIHLNGKSIYTLKHEEHARLISFIPAEPIHAPNMTVYEFVSLARFPYHGWFESLENADIELIDRSLESVHISNLANREVDSLSDGERQRAMIAFALAQNTQVILMDEPTAFLDLPTRFEIIYLLKKLTNEGKTIIFSTHDLQTSYNEVTNFWLMLKDEFISGSPKDLVTNGSINKLFEGSNVYFDMTTGFFTDLRRTYTNNN